MPDFHVLVVFNDRASTWVEVASSFDPSKLEALALYLTTADVVAQVVTCGDDSDAAIAFVVDSLRPPPGSFAAGMADAEAIADGGNLLFVPPRHKRRRVDV